MNPEHIALVVRRTIRAPVERVFAAWTQPDQLRRWWGPKTVVCPRADIDLRVGGEFRIANQFPDGKVVWISGEFELIEAPVKLIYTWRLGSEEAAAERVTVNFQRKGDSTEVVVIHERIASRAARDQHEQGWLGCLDGLEANFATDAADGPA
jgi:uncharacterized protein YndB with AHSA1/START domain